MVRVQKPCLCPCRSAPWFTPFSASKSSASP